MSNAAIVPFSEPPWLSGLPSPYYGESHRKWQNACRTFVDEHLAPHIIEWENEGEVPEHVFQTFSKHKMLIPNLPAPLPTALLKGMGIHELLGGLKVEDFDYFHFSIYTEELRRLGVGGTIASLVTGMAYGVPPIITYGSKDLQQRFLPSLIRGQQRVCIAITEPDAGSDVANITTTAVKSECGKFYIVNGEKKWITNGIWSQYATMAVRTGGPGPGGLSLLVVPLLGHPGVSMRRIKTGGESTSGTTFISLEDVKVPVENLVGEEGKGMKMITKNFNHERLSIAVGVCRTARVALSSAFSYVLKREAFGAPLMSQAVVRNRLARAGADLESLSAWLDQLVYAMTQLKKEEADVELGGQMALVKAKAGLVIAECAECAVLLFGGLGYTRTGQGEVVEKIYREVPSARIPGGSEDVMLDLAVRQMVKNYQVKCRALGRQKL